MTPLQRYVSQKGMSDKYHFVTTTDDMINNLVSAHRDLSYPLRKEVKRDRYVLNEQGLEKDIEKIVDEALQKAATPLIDLVSTDIANETYSKLEAIHNGTGATIKHTSQINHLGSMLGKILGKSIVEGVTGLFKE